MIPSFSKTSVLKKHCPQWITAFGVTVVLFEIGILCGWSSPYLAKLTGPDSPLPLTHDQAAWVASLLNLGRFIGAICGAVSVNYLGSKKSLLLAIVPIGCCWIFTMIADSFIWLYVARGSAGFGLGMAYSCFALFVGEVILPEIRGAVVSLAMAGGGSVGVVISSVCGSYLPMDTSAAVYLIPCILVGTLFLWLPESPHWLVKIGEYERAKSSIAWYQPGNDSDKEIDIIKDLVITSTSETFSDKIKKLKSKPIRKAILLIIILFTFMQITGLNSIVFYMETILRRSQLTLIDPSVVVIYVNSSGIVATIMSMFLIDSCGRKFLLIISCVGVSIAMAGLGANAYLIELDLHIANIQWLPLISIFLFIISYFIGLMCIPSTILSEIFPSDIKCLAGCIASLVAASWSFAATRSFQPMIDSIGETYVFWLHGGFALLLIPYICFCMPETKGKSLQEIQDKLMRK